MPDCLRRPIQGIDATMPLLAALSSYLHLFLEHGMGVDVALCLYYVAVLHFCCWRLAAVGD